MCKHPQCNHAECRSKTIPPRNIAVGKEKQYISYCNKQKDKDECRREIIMQGHTGNGQFSDRLFPCSILRFVPILPYIPPIKGYKKIIDIYAEIGIPGRLDSKQKYKLPASQYLPATNKHSPDILTTDKAIRQKFRKFPDSPLNQQ